jgi:hypothetical protein
LSICIPSSAEIIGSKCFESCVALSTVTFERASHRSRLEECAFFHCASLSFICIPTDRRRPRHDGSGLRHSKRLFWLQHRNGLSSFVSLAPNTQEWTKGLHFLHFQGAALTVTRMSLPLHISPMAAFSVPGQPRPPS